MTCLDVDAVLDAAGGNHSLGAEVIGYSHRHGNSNQKLVMGGDWAVYFTESSVKKVGAVGEKSGLVKYGDWTNTYTFKTYDAVKPGT